MWINCFSRLALLFLLAGGASGQDAKNPHFEPLFNGKDLAGWEGGGGSYAVTDGVLGCRKGKSGVLYTARQFGDCVIRLEYRLPAGGNNGVALRYPGQGTGSVDGMCEIQLLDDTHPKYAKLDPRQANGSAYGLVAAKKGHLKPLGEWNTMEIAVRGHTLRVDLNGVKIMEGDVSKVEKKMRKEPYPGLLRTTGHIGLCGHLDPVEFKSIGVQELK